MAYYIVNKNAQSGGEHEVHNTDTCNYLPDLENQVGIGNYQSCQEAVAAARVKWPDNVFDGCAHCSPDCHTR